MAGHILNDQNRLSDQEFPLISVLITAYNHELYAETAIQSILQQEGPFRLEVIYCDDASTDGTGTIIRELANKDARLKPILRHQNIGLVRNFADGLSQCRGDYIAYCDGDDFWLDDAKLSKQIDALNRYHDCSFCFHDVIISDASGNLSSNWSAGRKNQAWAEGLKCPEEFLKSKLITFHATSVLFRRSCIDFNFLNKIGSNIKGLDFGLAVMLGAHGPGYYFKETMASYRKHDLSISAQRYSPNGLRAALIEVAQLEKTINEHYDNIFQEFVAENRWGHIVNTLYSLAGFSKTTGSIRIFIQFMSVGISSLAMRLISFRDFIYIVRTEFFRFW